MKSELDNLHALLGNDRFQVQVRVIAVCISVSISTSYRYDGVALQMTLFFFPSRCYSRVQAAASNIYISCFHGHASHGGYFFTQTNPDPWFVKVVSTIWVRSHCLDDACFGYFGKGLTPSLALEVIRRLNNPFLAFKFFEFSRARLNINHFLTTYNLLIRSLFEMGLHDLAIEVFDTMRVDGRTPHQSVIAFLATSFAELGKFSVAQALVAQAEADNMALPCSVYNKLLTMLVKRNRVDEAICLFREHLDVHSCPDTCSFNIVINGLCKNDEVNKAHDMLKEIQSINAFSPDVVTYTSVISGYCKLRRMDEASTIFDEMMRSGIKPNTFTFNVLIDGYGKSSNMDMAIKMREKMDFFGCHPDVITFTSLIDGYCRVGQVDQALEIWLQLKATNLTPNPHTFAILINALCKECRLQEACEFWKLLREKKTVLKPFIYNPLIDALCKAGKLDEANMIIAELEKKKCNHDKMTYTILIIGHCMKGRVVEAISIFNKMLANECVPDDITTSTLISCLMKAGRPNDALRIRQLVAEDCNLGLSSSKRTLPIKKNTAIPVAVH